MLTTSLNGEPPTPSGNWWRNYSFYNWAAHMHHALLNAYKLPLQCTLTVAAKPAVRVRQATTSCGTADCAGAPAGLFCTTSSRKMQGRIND